MTIRAQDLVGLGVGKALREITALIGERSPENAEAEARMLLLAAAGLSRAELILNPDAKLDAGGAQRLEGFVARRLRGEPPTRILGERAFWTLSLRVTPDVLDPRADSETIVRAALECLGARKEQPLRILDLGTGTGALLLALLSECPLSSGVGVDLSAAACAVARDNAARNGLTDRARIVQGRWTDKLSEAFDLVVSNPPYIETGALAGLDAEVRDHDPALALDGGGDGLTAYRDILAGLPFVLKPGGWAVLELGMGQGPDVAALAAACGLEVLGFRRDLGGIDRALILRAASVG